ncbi:serine hydrolase [Kitasatospora sp. NPDC057015]|uniref:serine hydrolase n=1 Tax=Kitasatospora sp. NPDC057015 TaxID=3346001 RepID=UPI0036377ED2
MTARHRAARRRHRPLRAGLLTLAAAVAVALALDMGAGGGQLVARPATTATAGSTGTPSAAAGQDAADTAATRSVGAAVRSAGAGAEGAVAVAVLDLTSGAGAGADVLGSGPAGTASPAPVGSAPADSAPDDGGSDGGSSADGLVPGDGGHAFVTASIVKADILAALLRQSGSGIDAAQRTLAEAMIEQSDNDAASDLYDAIGGADGLDEANRAFGLTGTTAGRDGYWGLTTTTPADQLRLLRVIFTDDSPLAADDRAYLRKLMGLISADQAWGVSAAADPDGDRMLKNGWLPRTSDGLWAVNSIGLVTRADHEVLVAVLSDGNSTEEAGIALVESVAVAAVDALVDSGSD